MSIDTVRGIGEFATSPIGRAEISPISPTARGPTHQQGAGRLTPSNSVQPEDIRESDTNASRTESDFLILLGIQRNVRTHAHAAPSS